MALPKKGLKKAVKEEVVEVVEQEVVAEAAEKEVVVVDNTMAYTNPDDYVYEIKAGKTYQGFSAVEAMDFVNSLIGKVDQIVIKRKTPKEVG